MAMMTTMLMLLLMMQHDDYDDAGEDDDDDWRVMIDDDDGAASRQDTYSRYPLQCYEKPLDCNVQSDKYICVVNNRMALHAWRTIYSKGVSVLT